MLTRQLLSRAFIISPVCSFRNVHTNTEQFITPLHVKLPENLDNVVYPPSGERLLPELSKSPYADKKNIEDLKYITKRLIEIRGPELHHNFLLHEQYGIAAVTGGMLKFDHLEVLRTRINKRLEEEPHLENAFAVWRIDAPWLPRPKKSKGSKMGGGKGKVHHFVTPVKSERIILELGGYIVEDQARRLLEGLAQKLPFDARFVSQTILLQEKENEEVLRKNNKNKFTMEFCMRWNMHDCNRWMTPYDYLWQGKYR